VRRQRRRTRLLRRAPLRGHSVLAQMPEWRSSGNLWPVRFFLVEIPADTDPAVRARAGGTLGAAEARLRARARPTRILLAGVVVGQRRVVVLVAARDERAVEELVAVALLPAARIREVSRL
jgi:hypothetical protein